MSGHSKWNNIKRKKEASDSKKAKIFTKIGREMAIAIREGGGSDPSSNSKLKDIIAKAKANNVPNDNIFRMIQKYSGSGNTTNYEQISYEGYGPSGIAVIVETMTDNRNRTASEMRHYFDKFGGNMGTTGCVSWQFERKGVIVIEREDKTSEDKLMMQVLEAGASDMSSEDEVFEIYTLPDDLGTVRDALEAFGYTFLDTNVEMIAKNHITLTNEDDIKNMEKLLEMLEDNDDVQDVFHNWDNPED